MSATAGHPSLRARIATELGAVLLSHSPSALGATLGHAGSTVTRRGDELKNWPSDELLHLAARHPDLNHAVRVFLVGEVETGCALRVDDDLVETLSHLGGLLTSSAEALRGDRHCDADEARRLLPLIRNAESLMAQAARDLSALIARRSA